MLPLPRLSLSRGAPPDSGDHFPGSGWAGRAHVIQHNCPLKSVELWGEEGRETLQSHTPLSEFSDGYNLLFFMFKKSVSLKALWLF